MKCRFKGAKTTGEKFQSVKFGTKCKISDKVNIHHVQKKLDSLYLRSIFIKSSPSKSKGGHKNKLKA